MKVLTTFLIAALLSACAEKELPEYNQLGPLKVLALIAQSPEVYPGLPVTITPIVSDLHAGGRSLGYRLESCVDPGLGYGATPVCETPDFVETGRIKFTEGGSSYTGATQKIVVKVPRYALITSDPNQMKVGVPYLITYKVTPETGDPVSAFKRVVVSISTQPNKNPVFSSIEANQEAFTAYPTERVGLRAIFEEDQRQNYITYDSNGNEQTRREELTTTWFISHGSATQYRTIDQDINFFTPIVPKPMTPFVVVAVARDNRGGEAYRRFQF